MKIAYYRKPILLTKYSLWSKYTLVKIFKGADFQNHNNYNILA